VPGASRIPSSPNRLFGRIAKAARRMVVLVFTLSFALKGAGSVKSELLGS